jgi:hypothetical protein
VREVLNDDAEWMIKKLSKRKTQYLHMANPELADECFPEVQKSFPDAKMFKLSPYYQFMTVTKKAEQRLATDLLKRKEELLAKINEIDDILKKLQ